MAVSYRRTHVRHREAAVGPRQITVVPRVFREPGKAPYRIVHPASMSLQQFREGRQYSIVKGHLVHTPNKKQMGNPRNELAKRQMAALRAGRGNRCEVCETTAEEIAERHEPPLEFAHTAETEVVGMGRGRKERIVDIRKHPEHYALLCKPCHREFDEVLGPVPKEEL